ncbi:MAG: chemotaxis protein CheW [Bacteroidales bacterium]|nr:chemotaxis protein CheW [Bacteroidales bacterium]
MEKEVAEGINSYLVFKLGNEEFAANAGKVLHILELVKITEVPSSPNFMKGVINLRGTVLPVIDTRIKFGMNPIDYTGNTCIIVMESEVDDELIEVGALVDSVVSVAEYDQSQIKKPPIVSKESKNEFITGLVEQDDKFVMIIDIDKVFSTSEMFDLKNLTEQNKTVAETIDN